MLSTILAIVIVTALTCFYLMPPALRSRLIRVIRHRRFGRDPLWDHNQILETELIELTGSDVIARKLFKRIVEKYPDRNSIWYYQTCIEIIKVQNNKKASVFVPKNYSPSSKQPAPQQPVPKDKTDRNDSSSSEQPAYERPIPLDLHFRLIALTQDESLVKRLIQTLCTKYPDQTIEWCYEKAIYDLEKDRR